MEIEGCISRIWLDLWRRVNTLAAWSGKNKPFHLDKSSQTEILISAKRRCSILWNLVSDGFNYCALLLGICIKLYAIVRG